MRTNVAAIVGVALCIPCLIPVLLAAGFGAGTLSAFGAWFTGSSFVLGAAGLTAIATSLLAWAMYKRSATQAACRVPEAEEAQIEQ